MGDGHCHIEKMAGAEQVLKEELSTSTLQSFGERQSGCINDGLAYRTDHGPLFVKFNSNSAGVEMFQGEYESLKALRNTQVLTVPKPIKLIKLRNGSAMLVIEYLDMKQLRDFSALGQEVARLHLHNTEQGRRAKKAERTITAKELQYDYVDQYGFHVPTYAGYSRQSNEWNDSWVNFFARKMEDYVSLVEKKHNDRDSRPLWHSLVPHLSRLFHDVSVEPALLHGDLWRGNIAQTDRAPVSFDPISLYGHSEFDLSIMLKHGGFPSSFFNAYHSLVPKTPGFEDRYDLYSLHHHFQIWSHFGDDLVEDALGIVEPEVFKFAFGSGFKNSTLDLLRKLNRKLQTT
ncbi:fructosamine-3-kinase [Plakobranchus ocellatus]|uniref:protein-ribulosamine 3-kinase n=1 Tax=Plakobranchus ocellatus TaxID=259542 RepID=A0AAV4AMT4_9GAST|nr:fructosamine-3-kinase [Plakobranchus ocellatus]